MKLEQKVEEAKIADEVWNKYGVDEDELNEAIGYYNLVMDPEIYKLYAKKTTYMELDPLYFNTTDQRKIQKKSF